METFYLLLLIPVAIVIFSKVYFRYTIDWAEASIQFGVSIVLLAVVYFSGAYSTLSDTQIINGQITNKNRTEGTYLKPYSCHCRTVRSGKSTSTRCQTCYERRYTVSWDLSSTVGSFNVDYVDRSTRSVYSLPDPSIFTKAYVGEPAARESTYTNYIKAAPDSIFHAVGIVSNSYKLPAYPSVYDLYKVNHVHAVGIKKDKLLESTDAKISAALKTLGRDKEVNINVVVNTYKQQTYKYALERKWLGGKKNDVTVVIGTPYYPVVSWVQVFTYGNTADNNTLAVNLRDDLLKEGKITDNTASIIVRNVSAYYKRKPMKDFEYLKQEIDPPSWVVILSVITQLIVGVGLTYYFHRNDL